MSQKVFGALPPEGMEWQLGKTVASIKFVNDTEKFLETCQDVYSAELLLVAVRQIKMGQLVINTWLTPQQYLDQRG